MSIESKSSEDCKSCGNNFSGKYCNACGEKVLDEKERSIRYFLGQLINAITFADTKFLKTVKLLFTRPGFLALEYVEGRRNLYTKPIALFFIINILYFLFPGVDTFNSTLHSQLNGQRYSAYAQQTFDKNFAEDERSREVLETVYNKKSTEISKSILLLFSFLFSLPLSLVFMSRKQFYFNHLIFSVNFTSFLILGISFATFYLLYFVLYGLQLTGIDISDFDVNNDYVIGATLLAILIYLFLALRRFYQQKTWITALKSLLLAFTVFPVLIVYRFVLFLITLALI